MTAAIIALAVLCAGLAAAVVGVAIRMVGMRSELQQVNLQLAAARTSEADSRKMAELANEAAARVRFVAAETEAKRRAEIDELHEIAARNAGPKEIRDWLTRLTVKDLK